MALINPAIGTSQPFSVPEPTTSDPILENPIEQIAAQPVTTGGGGGGPTFPTPIPVGVPQIPTAPTGIFRGSAPAAARQPTAIVGPGLPFRYR